VDNLNLPDLSGLIGNMLSDPETLKNVLNVASGLKNAGVFSSLSRAPEEKEPFEEAYDKGEGAYTVKNGMSVKESPGEKSEESAQKGRPASFSKPPLAPLGLLSAPQKGGFEGSFAAKEKQCRRELLLALRPYLSKQRQEKLDSILQIFAFLELAESFGGLGSLGGVDRGREGGA
jgi:hypothetical protein